jgi:hypothetical protein
MNSLKLCPISNQPKNNITSKTALILFSRRLCWTLNERGTPWVKNHFFTRLDYVEDGREQNAILPFVFKKVEVPKVITPCALNS